MSSRPNWDDYFITQCDLVSTRGTCDRKQVGAVLVRDNRIIATGYNGSLPGQPHCDDPEVFWACGKCGAIINKEHINSQGKVSYTHSIFCAGATAREQNGGHDMEDGHCVRTIHAEVNTITQAAYLGISTKGATLYCNTLPCWKCFQTVVSAGIVEIIYRDEYRGELKGRIFNTAEQLPNFTLRQHNPRGG